jgi:hypothetical protein
VVGGLDGLLERVGVTAVLVEAVEGVHQQLRRLGRRGHQRHLDTDTQSIERLTMCIYMYRREREGRKCAYPSCGTTAEKGSSRPTLKWCMVCVDSSM